MAKYEQFQKAVNATKGHKTAFNAKYDAAVESINTYMTTVTEATLRAAERDTAKCDDYFDILQEKYLYAIDMEVEGDDKDQRAEKAKESCDNKLRETRIAVSNLRKEISRAQVKEAKAQVHNQSLMASPTKSGG